MVIQLRMLLNGRREQSARYGQLHPLDAAAHALNQRPILRYERPTALTRLQSVRVLAHA